MKGARIDMAQLSDNYLWDWSTRPTISDLSEDCTKLKKTQYNVPILVLVLMEGEVVVCSLTNISKKSYPVLTRKIY